jgi:hypothetical protein
VLDVGEFLQLAHWQLLLERAGSCFSPAASPAVPQAAANAKHNEGALKTKLFVSEVYANGGTILKRARTRAQGR